MKVIKLTLIAICITFLSSCGGGCRPCMMCDGTGSAYFELIGGETTCPDCGGDGCSSDGIGGDRRTGPEAWEQQHGE